MDRNNLSRVCAELETRGLIQRKVREEDRRHYTLELTDYGRAVYLRGDQAMENYRELTRRNYTPEEWSTFKDTLQGFFLNLVDIMEMPDDRLVPDPALKTPLKPGPAPERRDEHRDSPPDGVRGEHSQPKE